MDEDGEGQGPSGYAWYQLGRMAAENERHTSQTIRTLLHQRREASAWNAWQTQNEALAAENAQLRQELADYKRNYAELDAWARRAERQIAQLEQLNQKNR